MNNRGHGRMELPTISRGACRAREKRRYAKSWEHCSYVNFRVLEILRFQPFKVYYSYRHHGGYNVLFLDGHAAWYRDLPNTVETWGLKCHARRVPDVSKRANCKSLSLK